MVTFKDYLSNNASIINDYLKHFFARTDDADINKYLYEPLQEFINNAGKRHRPLICMLACKAVGGNEADALKSAAAIEIFHNAALIHDDIADNSTLRHAKPCLHLSVGTGLAINAGDMALSSMIPAVIEDDNLSEHIKLKVISELTAMNLRTIEGQALDLGWVHEHRFDLETQDYIKMATLKTAYYSGGTPLAVGAIIGGGTHAQVEALRKFGMLTGLAFQIQDDLLNLVGQKESVGKDFRSDITEGKRTFAALHALGSSKDSAELLQILESKTSEPACLERAVQIMVEAGSIDAAKKYASKLTNDAKCLLQPVLSECEEKTILLNMANYFIERLA